MIANRCLKTTLEKLCERLIKFDPDIVQIVQFGSSIYAPKHAKDVDLLILTKRKKDYSGYFDLVNEEDMPFNVEVCVFELHEKPRNGFLRNVIGAYEVIYGSGEPLNELAKALVDPTFEEARASVRAAQDYLKLGLTSSDPLVKDRHLREAFDTLFHAARIASMVYLSTEETKWGKVRKQLPSPYRKRLDEAIRTLHIDYFYKGNYPKQKAEVEFNRWLEKIRKYVEELEITCSAHQQ